LESIRALLKRVFNLIFISNFISSPMITTSQFSKDAKDFVALIEKKIILIEGAQLAEYMIENNVGVAEKSKLFGKEIGP
jgi:restriction endonuclease Mrr